MRLTSCNVLQAHSIFPDKLVASSEEGDLPLTAELTNIPFWEQREWIKSLDSTVNHSLQAGRWRLILTGRLSPLRSQIRPNRGAKATCSSDKSLTKEVLDTNCLSQFQQLPSLWGVTRDTNLRFLPPSPPSPIRYDGARPTVCLPTFRFSVTHCDSCRNQQQIEFVGCRVFQKQ